jgi:predicted dehydrogenase
MFMPRRLNVVFLGCGAITAVHGRTLAAFDEDVRCFYASRDAGKAMAFERRLHGGGSFGSYAAALADGRMDVAFVATPPATHLDLVLEALDRGKDVIVEKPAFTRAADYERVAREQARRGRRVLVAENYCYKPLARVLQGLMASQVVGRTLFVQINALKRQVPSGWRDDPARAGGGALLEGGIHWVDLMAHLGPPVRSVHGYRPNAGPDPERSMLVVAEYADGSIGTLLHSWEARSALRGLQLSRIRGHEGSILFESNGLFVLVAGRRRRLIMPGLGDVAGYRAMFRDFIGALRGEGEPLMTLARAREDAEIVESACGGGTDGSGDRRAHRPAGGSAHLDVGDVQGQPA